MMESAGLLVQDATVHQVMIVHHVVSIVNWFRVAVFVVMIGVVLGVRFMLGPVMKLVMVALDQRIFTVSSV